MRLITFLLIALLPVSGLAQIAAPQPALVEPVRDMGWRPDREAVKKLISELPREYFVQAAELTKDPSDNDALLYRFLQAARKETQLQPRNQGQTGSCVGYGTAATIDVRSAVQIYHVRAREEFVKSNADAVYALGRMHANQLGSWDGSTGAWSAAAIKERGVLFQLQYEGGIDLRVEKDTNARTWAARGLPAGLEKFAVDHKMLAVVLLKDADQLKAMLQNGYPAFVCSNVGFENGGGNALTVRDKDGFASARGTWNHCMACISYRGVQSGREGWLIWNSWNPAYITGPVWPPDQPVGSFWVDRATIERMILQRDSWAVGSLEGFRKRELSWGEAIGNAGGTRKEDSITN